MSQILENKISETRSLKEGPLYFRQFQEGFAIIWVIALMMTFAAFGSVIVSTYNVSLSGQVDASLSSKAESLAESGYRFLYSEYKNQSTDEDNNKLLEELHSKTFNISPDGKSGQFQVDMTSYFYRIETVTNNSELKVKFIGDPGFTVPATGYLRNIEDATLYEYGSQSSLNDVYTFNLSGGQTVPSTDRYTTVIPVAKITTIVVDADGTTLTLDSGQGAFFPPEKGMFLITKKAIKENLPVTQIVPYTYEYRDTDQLFKVDVGPGVGDFPTISSGEMAEVAKFVSLKSTGYFPDKANYIASELHDFNVSLDISASSTWHSSTGLKSYWGFDDAGTPGKDDYGISAGTLSGGGVTHTTTGKVGGALVFDGTDLVDTTFNAGTAVGNNQSFTVVFWAKPNSVAISDGVETVIGTAGTLAGSVVARFYFGTYQGRWFWGFGDTHGADWTNGYDIADLPYASPNSLPDASPPWQHVAYVYDGVDIILYVNGIEKYNENYLGDGSIANLSVAIGARTRTGGTQDATFDGTIDEVAIFNTALNICEIREIYNVPCNVGCGVFNTANDPGVNSVAYYPFNGNANDESGADKDGPFNNDGTVNGAVLTTDRFSCEAKAYSFDGSSAYIEGPNSASLELSDVQRVTVGAWVKKDSDPDGKIAIVQKSDKSYILRFDNNEPQFIIDQAPGKSEAKSGITVTTGVWYHLVGTYDGVDVKIYVDGVDETEVPKTASIMGSGSLYGLGIGKNLDKGNRYLEGEIDDISIWDRAMTIDQVLDYYNQTSHK